MDIFDKIIAGEIPSKKVYENDDVLAILDISQATVGHTLVIPKKCFKNLIEIDMDTYLKTMEAVKVVTDKLNKVLKPEGFNILNNCNEVAGQTVMHFHVHIIPRYNANDITISFTDNMGKVDLDKVLESINK